MRILIESILTIVFSFILGMIGVALCAIYAPEVLEALQINASFLKDDLLVLLTSAGAESNARVWIRFLVADEQLVFLLFVILSRIVLSLFFWFLRSIQDAVTGRG
ncbi:MAG: hypothetical protein AAFW46_11340 [Pseudomonadota bacterium]